MPYTDVFVCLFAACMLPVNQPPEGRVNGGREDTVYIARWQCTRCEYKANDKDNDIDVDDGDANANDKDDNNNKVTYSASRAYRLLC